MTIVPAGKTRVMVAQSFASPLAQGYSDEPKLAPDKPQQDTEALPDVPQVINKDSAEYVVDPEAEEMNPPELESQPDEMGNGVAEPNGKETLTDFIFKKLESFGYPARRLQDFKSKFVTETVTPEGIKDLKVEIPDRYYPDEQGNIKTIESEDLAGIVKEIQNKFGLNFNGANRSDSKWTINLTSAKKPTGEEEQGLQRDGLDEVYGSPGKSSGASKSKKDKGANQVRAFSQPEIIKGGKNELVNELVKILEKNNAS
jgi:hypothetical protein